MWSTGFTDLVFSFPAWSLTVLDMLVISIPRGAGSGPKIVCCSGVMELYTNWYASCACSSSLQLAFATSSPALLPVWKGTIATRLPSGRCTRKLSRWMWFLDVPSPTWVHAWTLSFASSRAFSQCALVIWWPTCTRTMKPITRRHMVLITRSGNL